MYWLFGILFSLNGYLSQLRYSREGLGLSPKQYALPSLGSGWGGGRMGGGEGVGTWIGMHNGKRQFAFFKKKSENEKRTKQKHKKNCTTQNRKTKQVQIHKIDPGTSRSYMWGSSPSLLGYLFFFPHATERVWNFSSVPFRQLPTHMLFPNPCVF